MRRAWIVGLALSALLFVPAGRAQPVLVLQSDFGTLDGAVASMKGVAVGVSPDIHIYDLTHHIEPYNIWQGALRLVQTAEYWPAGTVFVSVVDPGVGTERKSIVLKTNSGHYFVTPDNGTLTFVAPRLGIEAVREIDEAVNRAQEFRKVVYVPWARCLCVYRGATGGRRDQLSNRSGASCRRRSSRSRTRRARFADGVVYGNVQSHDGNYGNIWTNVDRVVFGKLGATIGDTLMIRILKDDEEVLNLAVPYVTTFGEVEIGQALALPEQPRQCLAGDQPGRFRRTLCSRVGSGMEHPDSALTAAFWRH